MSDQDYNDVLWTINRVWERDGEQAAYRLLRLVGLTHGEPVEEKMADAIMAGDIPLPLWM